MSNRVKRSYPRSLDDLCGNAWDLGYAAGQMDLLAQEADVAAEPTANPYYNYDEQE